MKPVPKKPAGRSSRGDLRGRAREEGPLASPSGGMVRVMAVDPGTRSGVSWATVERWSFADVVTSWAEETGGTCEVTGPTESHRAWAIMLKVAELEPDVVVVEDFILFPGETHHADRSGTEPDRINAVLRFLWVLPFLKVEDDEVMPEADLPALVWQMPGERYAVTIDELRQLGLYRTKGQGGGKDSTSATQHLLTYIKNQREGESSS